MYNNLNERLLIETYIAYYLTNKQIIKIYEQDGAELEGVMARVLGNSQDHETLEKYIQRCIKDFKIIGAMTSKAKIRRVLDRTERDYYEDWENEFKNHSNIRYAGSGRYGEDITYNNLNFSHLTPLDYTFTLKEYDEISAESKNVKKLYRIIMTLNSEYSVDDDELVENVTGYINSYIKTFENTTDVFSDFLETIDYIRNALDLVGTYDGEIDKRLAATKKVKQVTKENLNKLLMIFKGVYGFDANPIEEDKVREVIGRRRQTGDDKPKVKKEGIF